MFPWMRMRLSDDIWSLLHLLSITPFFELWIERLTVERGRLWVILGYGYGRRGGVDCHMGVIGEGVGGYGEIITLWHFIRNCYSL
jgi:hypothetical protein